eukprot:2653020-Alexandrium_andersonii.AAC.1
MLARPNPGRVILATRRTATVADETGTPRADAVSTHLMAPPSSMGGKAFITVRALELQLHIRPSRLNLGVQGGSMQRGRLCNGVFRR